MSTSLNEKFNQVATIQATSKEEITKENKADRDKNANK